MKCSTIYPQQFRYRNRYSKTYPHEPLLPALITRATAMENNVKGLRPTDAALLHWWRVRNERKAFNRFYNRYTPKIQQTAHFILRKHALEQDAVQDTWLEFLKYMDAHPQEPILDFKNWFVQVAKTKCLLILRTEKHHHHYELPPPPEDVVHYTTFPQDLDVIAEQEHEEWIDYLTPEELYLRNERIVNAREVLQKLPDYLKKIGWMHYVEDMLPAEISRRLNMSENKVSEYLSRVPEWIKKHCETEGFTKLRRPRGRPKNISINEVVKRG